MQFFKSHGKLLLTGEYAVLDGALALALPTKYAQTLKAEKIAEPEIIWKSFDLNSEVWLDARLPVADLKKRDQTTVGSNTKNPEDRLFSLFRSINELNPEAFKAKGGWKIETKADFPLEWGLGSSSTLIANLAKMFSVDAFELLQKTFGGSGYDVAVALEGSQLTYQLHEKSRSILSASFNPVFKDHLFFVYLKEKKNSRDAISHYRRQDGKLIETAVEKISSLTQQILSCTSLTEFNMLLEIHETLISQLVNLPKVKTRLFHDFPGQVKSLGGWGGDFVLATGSPQEMEYFRRKGYATIIPYSEMILQ